MCAFTPTYSAWRDAYSPAPFEVVPATAEEMSELIRAISAWAGAMHRVL